MITFTAAFVFPLWTMCWYTPLSLIPFYRPAMGILDILFLVSTLYSLVTALLIAYKCKWSGLVFVTIPTIAGSVFVRAVIAVIALILSTNGVSVDLCHSYFMGIILTSVIYVPKMIAYSPDLIEPSYRNTCGATINDCSNITFLTVSSQIALVVLGLVPSLFWFLNFGTNVHST